MYSVTCSRGQPVSATCNCHLTSYLALTQPHRRTLLLVYEFPHLPVPWFWGSERDTAAKCVTPNLLQLLALFKQLLAAPVCCPAISHLCLHILYHVPCNSLICSSNHCHLTQVVNGVQSTAVFGIIICLFTFNGYILGKWTSCMTTCGKSE